MSRPLQALLAQLDLQEVASDQFVGESQDLGWGRLFGGQVVAQALVAAARTAPAERSVHSLHAHFLATGDPALPVSCQVERTRDGGSFSVRRVVCSQAQGVILTATLSFHKLQPGLEHALPMPAVPGPEGLPSDYELVQRVADRLPPALRWAAAEPAIECRRVAPIDPRHPDRRPAVRDAWYKAPEALPDDPVLHAALLAYLSDFHFLTTALQPHGLSWLSPGLQSASLDHALWFHHPARVDAWLLHHMDSPAMAGSRALVRGSFFDATGRLFASSAQEGLLRKRTP